MPGRKKVRSRKRLESQNRFLNVRKIELDGEIWPLSGSEMGEDALVIEKTVGGFNSGWEEKILNELPGILIKHTMGSFILVLGSS